MTTSDPAAHAMRDGRTALSGLRSDGQGWWHGKFADVAIALAIATFAFVVSLITISHAPQLSAYDESTHVDYVWDVTHGSLPVTGEEFNSEVLHEWSCRGQANAPVPACGSAEAAEANNFPNKGVQYNAFHPPVYYWINGVITLAVESTTGLSFVSAARASNALLLGIGLALVYGAIRTWRVGRLSACAAVGLLLASPMFMHSGAIVTNDVVNAYAGAAAIFLLSRLYMLGRTPIISGIVFMTLIAGSKTIAAIALVAVGLVVGVDGLVRLVKRSTDGWARLALASGMALALVSVYFVWTKLQESRSVPGFENPVLGHHTRSVRGLPFDEWLTTLTRMFGMGGDYWLHEDLNVWSVRLSASVIVVLTAAVPITALVLFPKKSPQHIAAITLVTGLLILPIIVQVQAYGGSQHYFMSPSTRYAMALFPVSAFIAALIAEEKQWQRGFAVLSALLVILYSGSMLGLLGPF